MTDLDRQIDPDYPVKKGLSLYHAYNQGKFIGVAVTAHDYPVFRFFLSVQFRTLLIFFFLVIREPM